MSPWKLVSDVQLNTGSIPTLLLSLSVSVQASPTKMEKLSPNPEVCEPWSIFGLLPVCYALGSAKNDFHILITEEKSQEYFMMWK